MFCGRKKKIVIVILMLISFIGCLGYYIHRKRQEDIKRRNDYFRNIVEDYPEQIENTEPGVLDYHLNIVKTKGFIRNIKKKINRINENQHISNGFLFNRLKSENSVLVIQVHDDIRYLGVLLDSMRRVVGIKRCLLIFSHDYYNEAIKNVIGNITFARVMQIFYPYSIQLHPNTYPGGDSKFCEELNNCSKQKKRNEVLAQNKLFWWWSLTQVFENIEFIRNYNGYIYFLEVEQYVTRDFIYMLQMLERLQPMFCPECMVLAATAWRPQAEMYHIQSSHLIISAWGWSNFTNSGLGFNRTVWKLIQNLKENFCYFNDTRWDYSLRHLASKTEPRQFSMLASEGPRLFPTSGCGLRENGTGCYLKKNYEDMKKFVWSIMHGLFPHNIGLKRDDVMENNADIGRGDWSDARDREFCMFLASKGRREYY